MDHPLGNTKIESCINSKNVQTIRDLLDLDKLNDFSQCQCSRIDPKHKDCLSAMKWKAYDGYTSNIHLQFKAEREKFIKQQNNGHYNMHYRAQIKMIMYRII